MHYDVEILHCAPIAQNCPDDGMWEVSASAIDDQANDSLSRLSFPNVCLPPSSWVVLMCIYRPMPSSWCAMQPMHWIENQLCRRRENLTCSCRRPLFTLHTAQVFTRVEQISTSFPPFWIIRSTMGDMRRRSEYILHQSAAKLKGLFFTLLCALCQRRLCCRRNRMHMHCTMHMLSTNKECFFLFRSTLENWKIRWIFDSDRGIEYVPNALSWWLWWLIEG